MFNFFLSRTLHYTKHFHTHKFFPIFLTKPEISEHNLNYVSKKLFQNLVKHFSLCMGYLNMDISRVLTKTHNIIFCLSNIFCFSLCLKQNETTGFGTRTGFLNLEPIDTLGWMILCCGGSLVDCRVLSSIHGFPH